MDIQFTEFDRRSDNPLFYSSILFKREAARYWASQSFIYPSVYKQPDGFAPSPAQSSGVVGQVTPFSDSDLRKINAPLFTPFMVSGVSQ